MNALILHRWRQDEMTQIAEWMPMPYGTTRGRSTGQQNFVAMPDQAVERQSQEAE